MNNTGFELQIEGRERIAIEAAKEAGRILIDNFRKVIKVKSKKDKSLVTEVDLAAERKIAKLIKDNYPEDNILSEESQYHNFDSEFRWIIDPLDGTHNYIHQIEIFGTSIALEFKNEVILGVIYMPITEELYLAQKNKGAYRNGRRINVSKRSLREATMVYDSSIRHNKGPMLATLEKIVDKVFNIRMLGSSVRHLSYLAEGKIDLDIEYIDKVWDFAAGLLLIEEAGGKATDFQGKKWSSNTEGYIASNGIIHQEILKIIKERRI